MGEFPHTDTPAVSLHSVQNNNSVPVEATVRSENREKKRKDKNLMQRAEALKREIHEEKNGGKDENETKWHRAALHWTYVWQHVTIEKQN